MKIKWIVVVYAIILLWTLFPIISVMIAAGVASSCGCALDEGNSHPCLILGVDVGDLLYAMGVMGWFALLTIPTGVLALIICTVGVLLGVVKSMWER